ncbi:MAG: hypothetical protein CVT69_01450 [Actinobacteria bacterium HGW-Actinobacteria-9]|nr:MAG: hypothetical protein CVT69_01450 [Actinobacteria bacterium HGW-Actinobacteria-9]
MRSPMRPKVRWMAVAAEQKPATAQRGAAVPMLAEKQPRTGVEETWGLGRGSEAGAALTAAQPAGVGCRRSDAAATA